MNTPLRWVLALCLVLSTASGAAAAHFPLRFRVLLIIKPVSRIHIPGHGEIDGEIPADNIEAVTNAFTRDTPQMVDSLSDSKLAWEPEVVISSRPLTSVTFITPGYGAPAPADVAQDLAEYVQPGQYDGVFIYWRPGDPKDDHGLKTAFGLTSRPSLESHQAAFTAVCMEPTRLWTPDSDATEVFMHEWLHQLEDFYGPRGVKQPQEGLHGVDHYGFHRNENGWKDWYRAFINADLVDPDGTHVGLGDQAWELGTLREEVNQRSTRVLDVSLHMGQNLLQDGNFDTGRPWSIQAWSGASGAAAIGHGQAVLSSTTGDDITVYQTVQVRPHTRYLLWGEARTDAVEIVQQSPSPIGANLSLGGQSFDTGEPILTGTHDWTPVQLTFDSGDRTSIELGVRLGHFGNRARGTAWFRKLRLVPLSP